MHLTYLNSDGHKATASIANEPEAGAPEDETELAERIFNGLRSLDPHALVQGNPRRNDESTIDGTFNLRRLAALLLWGRS
jgi:hypothetical protein